MVWPCVTDRRVSVRPKLSWEEVERIDMAMFGVDGNLVGVGMAWKAAITLQQPWIRIHPWCTAERPKGYPPPAVH